MYAVPMLVLALVVVAGAVWSPIFALIVAVPLFALFLAYVGFARRADEKAADSSGAPVSGEGDEPHGGAWGERA